MFDISSQLNKSIGVSAHFTPVGGDSHMKVTGMIVVPFRGVNYGFWSRMEQQYF